MSWAHALSGARVTATSVRDSYDEHRRETDAEREFSILVKEREGYVIVAERNGLVPPAEIHVTSGAAGVVLKAAGGSSITGSVVDRDGQPVAAITIQARDPQKHASAVAHRETDEDGRFAIDGLSPGAC